MRILAGHRFLLLECVFRVQVEFFECEGFEPWSAARSQATYMFNTFNSGSLINELLVMPVDDAHQRLKVSVFRLHGCAVTRALAEQAVVTLNGTRAEHASSGSSTSSLPPARPSMFAAE